MALRRRPHAFWPALVIACVVLFGVSAIRPTVTYRALVLGASEWQIGLIAASFALLSLLFAIPIGRMVDRWGETRFVIAGTALMVAVSASLVFADNLVLLAIAQAALGMGHVLVAVSIQALIGNSDGDLAPGRFGNFSVAVSLGQLLGPLAATTVLTHYGATAVPFGLDGPGVVFLLVGLAQVVGVVLAASFSGAPRPEHHLTAPEQLERVKVLAVLRMRLVPTAVLASVVVVSTLDVIVVYLPVFGEDRGLPPSVVGILLAVLFAATIVSRLFLKRLRHFAPPPVLLTASTAIPAVAFAVTPFVTEPILLGVLFAAAGTGLGVGQPTSMSWVSGMVPRHVRATTLGLRLAGNRLAQIIVPIAVGALAFQLGVTSVFWALAALLIISALFTARSIGHEQPPADR